MSATPYVATLCAVTFIAIAVAITRHCIKRNRVQSMSLGLTACGAALFGFAQYARMPGNSVSGVPVDVREWLLVLLLAGVALHALAHAFERKR